MTDSVLVSQEGSLGRLTLNRPRAINALNTEMIHTVVSALEKWRDDDSVTAISIEGAGERGLCAGGDVISVRQAFVDGDANAAFDFFEVEYRMNAMIAEYPKLIVAYQDGIVMGGGVGISAFAGLRIGTERTKVAMPETIIGFFPDVGTLYLLSRAPGGLGAYLSATGATINGFDSCYVGFSDVVINSESWPKVCERLSKGASRDEAVAGLTVEGASDIKPQREWIDDAFGSGAQFHKAADAIKRLEASPNEQAQEAAKMLKARSPLSVAVSVEGMRRAASMPSVHEVLAQDMVLAHGLIEKGDFVEGVRAQLVDKDRTPKWSQSSLAEVSDEQVAALFSK